MTDAETPSDVTEQVVFDEVPTQGGNQEESDSAPVTTDIPTIAEAEEDSATTINPVVMDEVVEANTEPASVPVSSGPSSQESTVEEDSMPAATTVSPPSSD